MIKILAAVLALLAPLAQAQLQSRDFDNNGSIDGYYDSAQNLTWLADANVYATLGGPLNVSPFSWPSAPVYLAPGELRLQNAFTFLDSLVVSGVDGWRLPERLIPAGDPTGTLPQCNATSCYAGSYWPTELSNMINGQAGDLSMFSNVVNGNYMSVSFASNGFAQYVTWNNPITGYQFVTDETGLVWGNVWAVHEGDVATGSTAPVTPVPEPETYALMLAGLAAAALGRRRKNDRRPA